MSAFGTKRTFPFACRSALTKAHIVGLSLVRAFARLHGGDMTVESSVGEGTTGTIRRPVLTAEAAQPILLRKAN